LVQHNSLGYDEKHFMIGVEVSKYRIVEELGRGAMGIVFKAEDTVLGGFAALKIIAEKLANNPEMLHRFEREGRAASALQHPNICNVFESGDWKGRPYMAMELLSGQTLDDRLKSGPIPAPLLLEIAVGVASALEAAHAIGVIHRDIKPGNLFLTSSGQVKVLDFGLAKVRRPSAPIREDAPTAVTFVTRAGTLLGSLPYMPPEQIRCETLDGRADLFAFGVSLFELATGDLPIRGAENLAALPSGLGPIVGRLMVADVGKRYQTAREVREDLERCGNVRGPFERRALWRV
jgi:eukaryotic-like serine/threonine-protein kinase